LESNEEVPPIVHEVLGRAGRPLDAATRNFFEPRFGHDLSHVRVHTDAKAAESAQAVQAHAYTVGKDVVFGANEFALATHQGRELLAHELAHTIQQRDTSGSLLSAEQGGILESSAVAAGRAISSGGVVSRSLPACGRQIQRDPDRNPRWKSSVRAARYRGRLMADRIKKHGKLSREARAKINQELAYFEGDAKETYLREVGPTLKATVEIQMPEESVESEVPQPPPVTSSQVQPDQAEAQKTGPEYAPAREYAAELAKQQAEWEAKPEHTEQEREYEGMRAYYLSTRQSQLEQVADTRVQLRKDVYHMSPKQIYEKWQEGGQTWVALASSPGHGLGHEQFFHIWLENWRHRDNEARSNIDQIQKGEAARDPAAFRRKMVEFWDTGHNNRDAFGQEYRQAVELRELAAIMFRSSYDALIIASAAENAGKDLTLDQFDQLVLDHAALWGAITNIAGAYAAAYGGYSPSKVPSKVPAAPKSPPGPPPPAPDVVTPSRPTAGFARDIEPAPKPVPAPDPYVVTQMPAARVVQGNQPSYGNVKPAVEEGGQVPTPTPSRRIGFRPAPKDVAEKGLVEVDIGSRGYVKKEYFGDVGPGGEQLSRYHVNIQLNKRGMMEADLVLRGGGRRSGSLFGKEEFLEAKQHFEQANGSGSVKGVQGRWGAGEDNLNTFNQRFNVWKGRGLSDEAAMTEAARKTKTGEWAGAAGFKNVKVTKTEGSPGAFTNVEVEFTK
jgi:hypothetical protein